MDKNNLEIRYQVCSLADVLAYYAKGFEPLDNIEIVNHEAFVDTARGKVVFQLVTKKKES